MPQITMLAHAGFGSSSEDVCAGLEPCQVMQGHPRQAVKVVPRFQATGPTGQPEMSPTRNQVKASVRMHVGSEPGKRWL
jgi:hypothetical protein